MMSWQEIIVALIVLACLIEVTRRTFRFFRTARTSDNPCASCSTGCDLKRSFDAKQQQCKSGHKPPDKKCCG